MRQVRIQNDGKTGYMTTITDAETGEMIGDVTSLDLHIDVNQETPPYVTIVHDMPVVDVIADAEIKHVCPHCGSTDKVLHYNPNRRRGRDHDAG